MVANALGALLWLVIVGCLTVAMPVAGVLALAASALVAVKVRRS